MKTASVSTLKSSLSEFLAAVRRGEEVVITDRGVPVGRIVPVDGPEAGRARFARLVKQAILSPASRERRKPLLPPRGRKPAGVLAALLAEREESR
jgi:prevent-host-death family protein